mmetsp:Transcript_89730/g.187443  ORF Transcript_89730/g.187443 Transcript_89730/m.187443 type:complete len:369 (+) Transcript_89730:70-1176(+)
MGENEADADILYVSGLVAAIFKSPTWFAPIATYMDEHCAVFEDQEENKLEYTTIHNGFKSLVDQLLEAHLAELNVSEEQFKRFCQHGIHGDNEFHKELVEQLLSVDDFMFFKAMMIKRNALLCKQAMEVFGLVLEVSPAPPSEEKTEEERLQEEQAALEAEKMELQRKCVEAELQLAMALSMQLQKRLELMEALSDILQALTEAQDAAQAELAESAAQAAIETGMIQPLYTITDPGPPSLDDQYAAKEQRDRASEKMQAARATAAVRAANGPSEEERRARAEHLKRQRDALVAKKKAEREQVLEAHRSSSGTGTASDVVSTVMKDDRGKMLAAELAGQAPVAPKEPSAEEKAVAMRRALAEQLRASMR